LHGKCVFWWHPKFFPDIRRYRNGIDKTGGIERRTRHRLSSHKNGTLRLQEVFYVLHGREIYHGAVFEGNEDGSYIEVPYKDGVPFGRGAAFNAKGQLIREYVINKKGQQTTTNFSKLE
jgi:hypothetical protein